MSFDSHKNFSYSNVAIAPVPAGSGLTLSVTAGDGTKFPTTPFNAVVWPAGEMPLSTNATIIRVTNITSNTLTFTRTQEGSSDREIEIGDQIAASITNKTLDDIEDAIIDLQADVTNGVATLSTKGDISVMGPSGQAIRFPASGSNGDVITRDNTNAYGMKWATPAVAEVTLTNSVTLSNKTLTSPIINTPTFSAGAIKNADINDGEITMAKLATGVIGKLGYAQVTADQTSITTEVDLTGLTVTVTVPAGGRSIKITGDVTFSGTNGQSFDCFIKESTTVLGKASGTFIVNSKENTRTVRAVITPSAGSHTYKLSAQGTQATALEASATAPCSILVEAI